METAITLSTTYGNNITVRLMAIYGALWLEKFGYKYRVTNWRAMGGKLKALTKYYSEPQIAALMIVHFNWHGSSGTDTFAHKNLRESMFPLEWIAARANNYIFYFQEVSGIDFDNNEEVLEWVETHMRELSTGK